MNRLPHRFSVLALGLGVLTASSAPAAPLTSTQALGAVRHWGIQLSNFPQGIAGLRSAPFDLLVIEPNDDNGLPWPRAEVEAAGTNKLLIAYLSMGAAESYRPYWQKGWKVGHPAWLLSQDPDWPGNYDVAYWNPEWKAVALASLDRVIDQGFDGVYMDLIDAYMRHPQRSSARAEMVRWVCEIAAHARARRKGFLIIPQNAPDLLTDPGYAGCVDAAAQEETFVYATDKVTEAERQRELLAQFEGWKKLGKPVLTLDYASTNTLTAQTYARARAEGLIPYISVRDLDVLTPGR